MRYTIGAALVATGLLTGCAGMDSQTVGAAIPTYAEAELATYRFVQSGLAMPFEGGQTVTAIAASDFGVDTFSLVPCRGGAAICAGSATGPAGTTRTTADYLIVSGLYGVELWLSPGGDGSVLYPGGTAVPLAWE